MEKKCLRATCLGKKKKKIPISSSLVSANIIEFTNDGICTGI